MWWKASRVLSFIVFSAVIVLFLLYCFCFSSYHERKRDTDIPSDFNHPQSSLRLPSLVVPLPYRPGERFTIVIQTYRRQQLLRRILPHYCNMSLVDRILVVWNNINTSVPPDLHSLECSRAELKFLPMSRNTVRNRFQPFPQISTEGSL